MDILSGTSIMEAGMQVPDRIRAGIVVIGALLAMAACTSTRSNTGGPTPPPASATASGGSGGGSTGGASASSGPATPAALGYPSDAQGYAQAALTAWAAGDQARLDQLRDAANPVFQAISSPTYDHHFQLYQCQGAAGTSYCMVFNNVGDELVLRLSNPLLGHPHALVGGDFHPITFPADMRAYAQEALDAWLAHNTARIGLLLTPDAVSHLNAIAASHQADGWTFGDSQGAAGSSYLSWANPAGDRIAFKFYNPGVVPSESPQHRIHDVLFLPHS
jgi:hypothetical protein